MLRTVRIGSRSRSFDSALRRRPTCTSTVRSLISSPTPNAVQQLGASEHPARLLQQVFEQPGRVSPDAFCDQGRGR